MFGKKSNPVDKSKSESLLLKNDFIMASPDNQSIFKEMASPSSPSYNYTGNILLDRQGSSQASPINSLHNIF